MTCLSQEVQSRVVPISKSRIGDEIARLAQIGGLSHDEIAILVRRRVPGAETSAKSVASVVHALRKNGVHIPRRPTGPLPAEVVVAEIASN